MQTSKYHYTSSSSIDSDSDSHSNNNLERKQSIITRGPSIDYQQNSNHLYHRATSLEYLASVAASNCQPLAISKTDINSNTTNMRTNMSNNTARRPNVIASTSSTNFYVPSVSSSTDRTYSNRYSYSNTAASNQDNNIRYGMNNTNRFLYTSTENKRNLPPSDNYRDGVSTSLVDPNIFTEDQKRTIVNAFRRLSSVDIEPFPLEDVSHSTVPPSPFHQEKDDVQQDKQEQERSKTCQSNRIQKQKFLIFIYLLFKILDEETRREESTIDDSSHHLTKCKTINRKARHAVKECTRGLRLGLQGYSPIMDAVINKLQGIKGIDKSWERADRYLKLYWKIYSKKSVERMELANQKRRWNEDVVTSSESFVGKSDVYSDDSYQKSPKSKCFTAQV